MDFFILLGFKFFFDLLWPDPKAASKTHDTLSNKEGAAFWYGTSFENLENTNSTGANYSDSEYGNV